MTEKYGSAGPSFSPRAPRLVEQLYQRQFNRRICGSQDSVLRLVAAFGCVNVAAMIIRVDDPDVSHTRRQIFVDLFLYLAGSVVGRGHLDDQEGNLRDGTAFRPRGGQSADKHPEHDTAG